MCASNEREREYLDVSEAWLERGVGVLRKLVFSLLAFFLPSAGIENGLKFQQKNGDGDLGERKRTSL